MRVHTFHLACAAAMALTASLPAHSAPRDGGSIVAAQCANCHAAGLHGAPRLGDSKAWIERTRRGLDTLQASAIRGHGAMPARGGMADLTDPELRSAIDYMVRNSVRSEPNPAAPAKR